MAEVRDRIRLMIDADPDVDNDELVKLTIELRDRVLEVDDVHAVDRVPDPAPQPGVMAGEAFLSGQLDVLVPFAAIALHQVFSTIRTYIRERPWLSVTILPDRKGNPTHLEITGTSRDVETLVRRFLEQAERPEQGRAGS